MLTPQVGGLQTIDKTVANLVYDVASRYRSSAGGHLSFNWAHMQAPLCTWIFFWITSSTREEAAPNSVPLVFCLVVGVQMLAISLLHGSHFHRNKTITSKAQLEGMTPFAALNSERHFLDTFVIRLLFNLTTLA